MQQYALGIDIGTCGVRVGLFDLRGNEITFWDEPLELLTPRPGFAEQRPQDWWAALCKACRNAVQKSGIAAGQIVGIGTDTTACTLVFLDEEKEPLQNAIMWMDLRAVDQAKRAEKTGHPILKYTGFSNISAEWMPHKTLWVKENRPEVYEKTKYILECNDWIGYLLTGKMIKNRSDAASRWYFNNREGGWQRDFFDMLDLGDLMEKIPLEVKKMGDYLGALTKEAADALGLVEGIPVAVGGADAYVAMAGLGVLDEGKSALVTGSSHLLLTLSKEPIHAPGIFGSFPDAVVDGLEMIEAGLTSSGSIVNWFKNKFLHEIESHAQSPKESAYDILNREASEIPIGAQGLICLDHFQGCRTPHVDGNMRGILAGLSLVHTPAHIYRALVEGICYGTEMIFRLLGRHIKLPHEIVACGGATKSRFWMQTHADVSNIAIHIPKINEAPVLGSAILGAVAGGVYGSVSEASRNMTEIIDRIEPNQERHQEYRFYVQKYAELYPLMSDWMHGLVKHEREKKTIT